jgi:hypothetical protein
MTNLPLGGGLTGWLVAAFGLLTLVVVVGVSLLAGLFLLIPLAFVTVLLRTAFRHYFGEAESPPRA